jgi:hypothetical protein
MWILLVCMSRLETNISHRLIKRTDGFIISDQKLLEKGM